MVNYLRNSFQEQMKLCFNEKDFLLFIKVLNPYIRLQSMQSTLLASSRIHSSFVMMKL